MAASASSRMGLPELGGSSGKAPGGGGAAIVRRLFSAFSRNRSAGLAAVLLAAIVLICAGGAAAPAIRRHDTTATDYDAVNSGPSLSHPLGTDQLGRDTWSRLLAGTFFSLKVGIVAELIAVVVGFALGMAAALGSKWIDQLVVWLCDFAYAVPELLLAMVLRQVLLGRDLPVIGSGDPQIIGLPGPLLVTVLAISFASWATTCRLVRAQAKGLARSEMIMAARSTGASEWRIATAHVLPNLLNPLIVAVTFGIPARIFAEASLGFLGLSVAPPFASLGTLVSDGYQRIHVNSLLVIWPCATIALLMLCFTLLGEGLRNRMDPRARGR